jgi:hypothetical protein
MGRNIPIWYNLKEYRNLDTSKNTGNTGVFDFWNDFFNTKELIIL